MLFKKLKKGFTLIELVVVIAVIAILSAVAVVSYLSITNKAKESNDHMVIDQVNTLVQSSTYMSRKATVHELVESLDKEDGYDIRKISPELKGTKFVYCYDENMFGYWKNNKVVYPKALEGKGAGDGNNIWFFEDVAASSYADGYSHYLKSSSISAVSADGGIDLGDCSSITSVSFARSTKAAKDVVIRTNSASVSLTVNAPKDVIYHYDALGSLNIVESATASYHEKGKVAYAEISKGRIVLERGSDVEEIHVNKKNNSSFDTVIIANKGGSEELPERITRDAVTVSEETLVVKVESNGSTENVYVYANGSTGTTEKVTEGVNKQNEAVNSALGQLVLDNGSKPGEKAQTAEQKAETKTAAVEEAKSNEEAENLTVTFWEQCADDVTFYGGKGQENDPYLISSATQLALMAKNINDGVQLTSEQVAQGYHAYYGAYYKLIANINISKLAWTPIGAEELKPFSGHIDGNNKTITGMTNGAYRGPESENEFTHHIGATYGFIGFTRDVVSVTDLTITDISVDYANAKICGGLIGSTQTNKTTPTTSLTISNVHISGNVKGYDKVAGLVGYLLSESDAALDVSVENCTVDGTVSLTDYMDTKLNKGYRAGGLFGFISIKKSNTSIVKDCTVSANISKGDSSSDCFWLGSISSGYNSAASMTIRNFKFIDGTINGQSLKPLVAKKSKTNEYENVYTQYADLSDKNGNSLIGCMGQAGEIWWCHTAHDTRIKDPDEVVDAIIGENRNFEYHLTSPEANADGSYSFVIDGAAVTTNFNLGNGHKVQIGIGGNYRVYVDYETGAITDLDNILTSGHTTITSEYTYYDLLKEVMQNHFISEIAENE